MNTSRARLLEIIRTRSFKTGDFTLSSGQKSTYYIDGKQTTLDAEGSALLAEAILETIAGDAVTAVGGLTLGADPIVGATVCLSFLRGRPLRGFIVRKEVKAHGTSRPIEGDLRPGEGVAVIEDVTTTGASAFKAIEAVEAAGGRVLRVVSMVDRLQGAEKAFAERGYAFSPIFTLRDLVHEDGRF